MFVSLPNNDGYINHEKIICFFKLDHPGKSVFYIIVDYVDLTRNMRFKYNYENIDKRNRELEEFAARVNDAYNSYGKVFEDIICH